MSKDRVCCNCRHNIRTEKDELIESHCEIDGSYIGYAKCFEGWCKHWAKEAENEVNRR